MAASPRVPDKALSTFKDLDCSTPLRRITCRNIGAHADDLSATHGNSGNGGLEAASAATLLTIEAANLRTSLTGPEQSDSSSLKFHMEPTKSHKARMGRNTMVGPTWPAWAQTQW